MMRKKHLAMALIVVTWIGISALPAMARQFKVAGRPLNVFAYLTQSVQCSLVDKDYYDTEHDVNTALFNFLVEAGYSLRPDLKVYGAGMITVDWMYDLKHDDNSWDDKGFSDSRSELYFDDHYWQLLKELHLTWTPPNFFLRLGKQIVVWGETDGFRLMDQINPLDQRRGFADVEFESSVIPIWLARAEYYLPWKPHWIQDLGIEFVFNPNADFIPDQMIKSGNDKGGIWAPDITVDFPPLPFLPDEGRIGSAASIDLDEPDDWDQEGHEYAARLKMMLYDTIVTFNYFYGYANTEVTRAAGMQLLPPAYDNKGRLILHPRLEGYYPRFRFVGVTASRDLDFLRAPVLGGVSPVVRMETFYAFDSTFSTSSNTFEKSDEIRWAVGLDWKVKIDLLNPKHYFMVSPQVYHQKIRDYPHGYEYQMLEDDNYMGTLMLNTNYAHGKIVPSFFLMRDFTNRAYFYKAQVAYDRSHEWHYILGVMVFNGKEGGKGFDVFENKDYVFFKIAYKWG